MLNQFPKSLKRALIRIGRRELRDKLREISEEYGIEGVEINPAYTSQSARPYFHYRLTGGEGHMLIGKVLNAYPNNEAHMVCELSPCGSLSNTMSVGAMAKVLADYPDLLYAPIEIKGDAEVHAYSRCQMILIEAKRIAKEEFERVLEHTKLRVKEIREFEQKHPELIRATYKVPHYGFARTSANYVYHVAKLMRKVLEGVDHG